MLFGFFMYIIIFFQNFKKQSTLALNLLCNIVAHGDLACNSLFTLCNNLWLLAQRHGHCDPKQAVSKVKN